MKRVLILNAILYTPENGRKLDSIKDSLLVTVCKGFIKVGYVPTLIADSYYKPMILEDYGFKIVYLDHSFEKLFSPYKMPLPKGLHKYLIQHKNDYDFIVSSEVFSWYSFIAAITDKKKLIIWHELAVHNKMFKGYASRIWYGIFGRLIFRDVLIAPRSEKAKVFISKYCKIIDENVYQHPIDVDKFQFESSKSNYFVSVSQLVERKNVDKIIEKYCDFYKEHKDYKLIICGDGEEKRELIELSIKFGLQNEVCFKGLVGHEELSVILKKSKALLIYTNQDNSILTISEAIASGTPIITTSVPDNAAFVRTTKTGIVKDEWGKFALEEITRENAEYISNCESARKKITNIYIANMFVNLSKQLKGA